MNTLIELLEKATGPDVELDANIATALGIKVYLKTRQDGQGSWKLYEFGNGRGVPAYTSSIEAALTLLLSPRWFWRIDSHDPEAIVYLNIQDAYKGRGATPVLSLCIAAMKARQAKHGETGT